MSNKLEINISAPLGPAINNINQFSNAVAAASSTVKDMLPNVSKAGAGLAALPSQLGPGSAALKSTAAAAGVVKNSLAAIPSTAATVSNSMRATGNATFAFNQILREGPAFAFSFQTGLLAISNNLPVFTDALKNARASGASWGTVLKDIGKNLLSFPSLLTVGVTALTIFGGALFGTKKESKELKKANDELANSIAGISKEFGKELATLDQLYKTATAANKPIKEKKQAVDALQAQYPAYFKNLSDEAILAGRAEQQYNALRDSIVRTGLARIAQAKAQPLFEELFRIEQQISTDTGLTDAENRRKNQGKLKIELQNEKTRLEKELAADLAKGGNGVAIRYKIALLGDVNNVEDNGVTGRIVSKLAADRDRITKAISRLFAVGDAFGEKGLITDLFTSYSQSAKKDQAGKTPFDVDIDALENNLAQAKAAIVKANTEIFNQLSKNKTAPEIDLLKEVFKGTQDEEFLRLEEDFLNRKIGIYQKYKKETGALTLELRNVQQQLAESIKPKFSATSLIAPEQAPTLGTPTGKPKGSPAVASFFADLDALAEKQRKTAAFVQDVLTPVYDQFFSNLASGGRSALQAFGDAIKSVVVELGKAILKALVFAAIQTAIAPGSGGFGANFKGLFGQFSGLKLAAGGVATGPTRALIAEAGVPEAVIPLNRLPDMVNAINARGGGGQQVFIPELRIGMNELIIGFNRATGSNQSRF